MASALCGYPQPKPICCDTCPLAPTCEEENDFLADIGLAPGWGEEYDDGDERAFDDAAGDTQDDPHDLGYCVTPGCNCCDDPAD